MTTARTPRRPQSKHPRESRTPAPQTLAFAAPETRPLEGDRAVPRELLVAPRISAD